MNYIVRDPFESDHPHTVPLDRRQRRVWPDGSVREGHRGLDGTDLDASRTQHRGPALSAGDEPRAHREGGLSAQLPQPARRGLLPLRRRDGNPQQPSTRPAKDGGWTARADGDRPRADAGGLLSALSAGRRARPHAGNGLLFDVACDCFRHEPSQNVDRLQSLPHARICPHRHARAGRPISASAGSSAARRSPISSA